MNMKGTPGTKKGTVHDEKQIRTQETTTSHMDAHKCPCRELTEVTQEDQNTEEVQEEKTGIKGDECPSASMGHATYKSL